jgi:hypothetical protein
MNIIISLIGESLMTSHHAPCVMTETDQFFVRICGCGVVHLNIGFAVINLSPEATIAVTETLKEVSAKLRKQMEIMDPVNSDQATLDSMGNVIVGKFS